MDHEITTDFCRKAEIMPATAFVLLVGWTPETEQQMRSRGKVPPSQKIGRATFYKYADVAAFIEQHRIVPVGDAVSKSLMGVR